MVSADWVTFIFCALDVDDMLNPNPVGSIGCVLCVGSECNAMPLTVQ